MKEILEKLSTIQGVRGVALISKDDGLIIEKIFYDASSSEIMGAMIANMSREMENALGKATDRIPVLSTLYAEKGEIVFIAKSEFILTVLCEKTINLGVVIIKLRETASEIQPQL